MARRLPGAGDRALGGRELRRARRVEGFSVHRRGRKRRHRAERHPARPALRDADRRTGSDADGHGQGGRRAGRRTKVTFEVTAGPNLGLKDEETTDDKGQAFFTYTSTAVGTDTIKASFVDSGGKTQFNTARVTWEEATELLADLE